MQQRKLTILGSTGSIGTQALDVVRHQGGMLDVVALSARGTNLELLQAQIEEFQPSVVHVADLDAASALSDKLGEEGPEVLTGEEGLVRVAGEIYCHMVVVATVGWTGVEPTMAAIEAGREIALANKEVLVCAGEVVMSRAAEVGVPIWPLDSEHNAIAQCLAAGPIGPRAPIRRLVLTCSGGPFRNWGREEIDAAGPERTLKHPTWEMGRKISVDSATLMNKGFEVIEAHHLFEVPYEKIQVIVHPQSVVHSMVEFVDGSMIAQMGVTDMRLPIQNVLTYPFRRPAPTEALNLAEVGKLEFEDPDMERFPNLGLAYRAGREGGTAPCALNAANEVAVAAHLENKITCGMISRVLQRVMVEHENDRSPTIETFKTTDRRARKAAARIVDEFAHVAKQS